MARTRSDENKIDPGLKGTGGKQKLLSAGVEYRGPGQYRARKVVDGKRVYSPTFEANDLAAAWLKKTEVQADDGTFVDRSALDRITLKEVVEAFEVTEMQVGGKRRGAAEDLGHTPSFRDDVIGGLTLAKLTPRAVEGFKDRQEAAGRAPGTIVKRLNLLSTILKQAIRKRGLPMVNPATAAAVPRPPGADTRRDRRLEIPTPSQLRAAAEAGEEPLKKEEDILFEYLAKSKYPDDIPVTKLAIAQALRQGEICALRLCDIDFDTKQITVRGRHGIGTKTGDKRKTVRRKAERGWEIRAMTPEAIAVLKEHLAGKALKPNDLVFSVGGANGFKVRFMRMRQEANVVSLLLEFTFHDLRHEATSRLARRYKNPLDLMRVTGHIDVKSMNRYYHPDLTAIANMALDSEAAGTSTPTTGILQLALAAFGRGELTVDQVMQISQAGLLAAA
jgi:integrase